MERDMVFEMISEINSRSPVPSRPGSRDSTGSASTAPPPSRRASKRMGDLKGPAIADEAAHERAAASPPPSPGYRQKFVALLAGCQFAVVILIAQRRIPLADGTEFFVVLAQLMITAAHGKILDFLPDGSRIRSDKDVLTFLLLVIPIFFFMNLIELWFIVYLFQYEPDVELSDFRENAPKVLLIGKVLSITKMALVFSFIVLPRILRFVRKLSKR